MHMLLLVQAALPAAVLAVSDSLFAAEGSESGYSPQPPHPEDVEAPNGSGRLSFSAFGSAPCR